MRTDPSQRRTAKWVPRGPGRGAVVVRDVDPAVRTGAPITWLVDPRAPARLHRRLARVGTTVCTVAADHPGGAGGRRPRRRFRRVEPSPLRSTADELRLLQLESQERVGGVLRRGAWIALGTLCLLVAWIGSHAETSLAQSMGVSYTEKTVPMCEDYLTRFG